MFSIGDEWTANGDGNYIIVDVKSDDGFNRVLVFDYEGCVAWEAEVIWKEFVSEMDLTLVSDTVSVKERIESWVEQHPVEFIKQYKGTTAWWRKETEPCQAGTPGCCINHSPKHDSCEPW